MKKVLIASSLLISLGALGHEFWLQPSRFFVRPGDEISLQVLVGEHFSGERSEGKKNRIISYRHHAATGTADITPTLTGDTYSDVLVSLNTEGTHLFTFMNTPKFLSMKADSFLLYLQEDGLDNIITARQQQGESNKPSRELYQRCAKSLVQVGDTPDRTFSKNTGMTLEIIPAKNPYTQRFGQTAEFKILFMDKPLEGALVRYWNRNATNQTLEEKQRTNALGDVSFRLRPGRNMVSVVHMVPAKDTTQTRYGSADWHSYWGSLTFGSR
ncbi:DUF4198 domain-containing protein [Spirosoma soli]|uniref:DUF4198 domain-containing protein n=1 Tax=Spirosoma soli TaxID=1770529 RepID=A0ABW5LWP0_9BACT